MFYVQRVSSQTQQFVTQREELTGHLCSVENLPGRLLARRLDVISV
jgi:hypothetical protein